MRKLVILALIAAAALVSFVDASFRVVTPVREGAGDIDHKFALFGRPTYGGNLVAPLARAPPSNEDACHAFTSHELHAGLVANTNAQYEQEEHDEDGGSPEAFVLLVKRGSCHFVEKARHAQNAGAVALVIYDTADNDHAKLPVLADDGSGSDIHIPSLMIHYKDAADLQELLTTATSRTVVALNWDVPHPDGRVEVALYLSSRSSPQIHSFIDHFRPVIAALGDKILFTPYYDVHVGSAWGCLSSGNDSTASSNCPQLCVDDGAFCTYDPERNTTIGLDGKDVLEEDLRQLCIYQYAQRTYNTSVLYWEYLAAFNTKCSVAQATAQQFNRHCSESVQRELGIPSTANCAQIRDPAVVKSMLQRQIDALRTVHVMAFPEWTVNDVPLYGGIACDAPISLATCAPLKMICAGFSEDTAPPACHETFWTNTTHDHVPLGCVAPMETDDCGVCGMRGSSQWNAQCAGCDGVAHSNTTTDLCGHCLSETDPSRGASCLDCKGVPNGFAKRDACGVCDGHGSFDACGLCLAASDPRRQNFKCHVSDDPDAVTAKLEIRGIRMKQFRGALVESFQAAVGFVVGVPSDHVLIKTVDDSVAPRRGDDAASVPPSPPSSTVVLFFVACPTDRCRANVAAKLGDSSTPLAIAMRMKSALEKDRYGLQESKSIKHVALHAVNGELANEEASSSAPHSPLWWQSVVVASAMTLAVGFVVLRVRDDRMRRDFEQLVARYTPLTAMDGDDEREDGRTGRGGDETGADAW